jgi:SAM-dependent methyltransferase
LAAKRLAKSLGLPFEGVVGDARYIPVASAAVDAVFSYSVLQHFSKADALLAFAEASRVLTAGGLAMIQMASATGIRSLQHQLSRRFSRPENFDVRYWMPGDLLKAFQAVFGSGELSVDCFFGLGLQASDAHLMPLPKRSLIVISECLRAMSAYAPLLTWCADSVYLTGRKNLTNRERSGG